MWRGNPGGCHYRLLHFYISENLHEITNKELTLIANGWGGMIFLDSYISLKKWV